MNSFRANIHLNHLNNTNAIIVKSQPLPESIISHEIPQYLNYAFSFIRATRASLAFQLADQISSNPSFKPMSKSKIKIILPTIAHPNFGNIDISIILKKFEELPKETKDLSERLYAQNFYLVDDAFRFTRRVFDDTYKTEILYYSTKSPESIANLYFKRFGLSHFILYNYLSIPVLKSNYQSYNRKEVQRLLSLFSRKTEKILMVDKNQSISCSYRDAIEEFEQTDEGKQIMSLMNIYNQELDNNQIRNEKLNSEYANFFSELSLHFRSYLKDVETKSNRSNFSGSEIQMVEYLKYTLFAFSEYLLSYRDILIDNPYEMLFSIGYILFAQKKRLEKINNVDEQKKQAAISCIDEILAEIGLKFEKNNESNSDVRSFSSLYYQYIKLICEFENKLNRLDSEADYNIISNFNNSVPLQKKIYLSKCDMENKFHLIYNKIFEQYAKILNEIEHFDKRTFEMELITVRCISYYLKHTFFYTPSHYLDIANRFLLSIENIKKFVNSKCKSNRVDVIYSTALNELKTALSMTKEEQAKFDLFVNILKKSMQEEEQYYQNLNLLKSKILQTALSISDKRFQIIKEMLLLELLITTTHGFYKSQIPMKMSVDAILYNPYNAAMLVSIKASLCSYARTSKNCDYKIKIVNSVLGMVDAFTTNMNSLLFEMLKPVHLPLAQPFFAYDNGVPLDKLANLRSSSMIKEPKRGTKKKNKAQEISPDELICFANLNTIGSYSGSFEKPDPLASIVIGDSMYSGNLNKQKQYIFLPFREKEHTSYEKTKYIDNVVLSLALFAFSSEIYLEFEDTKQLIEKESLEYNNLLRRYIEAHRQRFINGAIIEEKDKRISYFPAIISMVKDPKAEDFNPDKEKELILGLFYSNIITSTMIYSLLSSLIEKD